MPQADRDFLAAYVRAQPSRAKDESLEDYLRRVKVDPGPPGKQEPDEETAPAQAMAAPPSKEQREQARLRKNAQLQQNKAAADAKLAAEDEQLKQQAKNSNLIGKGLYAAGIVPNKAADTVERARNWLANLPTPGGNGALLLVLLGFVAFIVPVSGAYTRAQLFWLSLLGRTSLDDTKPGEPGTSEPRAALGEPGTSEPRAALGEPAPIEPRAALPFTLPMPGMSGPQLPSSIR